MDTSLDDVLAHIEEVEISLSNQMKAIDKKLFRLETLVTSLVRLRESQDA